MIKIYVLRAGRVLVSPHLSFGGEGCSTLKASGLLLPKERRVWLPVSAYLIEHPRGLVLLDTGWSREMSPAGAFDAAAQRRHLGHMLAKVNQGEVRPGQTVREQLAETGIAPADLACVLVSHLDCDHASGLMDLPDAPRVLVSSDELRMVRHPGMVGSVRFNAHWWAKSRLESFEFAQTGAGPVGRSHDLFGDGTIELVSIPGHRKGMFATVVRGGDGRFINIVADGAYGRRSWEDMVLPGISMDKEAQRASLEWIRATAADHRCIETLANHDTEVKPHVIELP